MVGRVPCEALIGVHHALRGALMGPDRPSMVDLLQAARLTHQQLDRGSDLQQPLYTDCEDIYVRPQRKNATKMVSYTLL